MYPQVHFSHSNLLLFQDELVWALLFPGFHPSFTLLFNRAVPFKFYIDMATGGSELEIVRQPSIWRDCYVLNDLTAWLVRHRPSVTHLCLEANNFKGAVPGRVRDLKMLKRLYLNSNPLSTGESLPSCVVHMELEGVDVDLSGMSLKLPEKFEKLGLDVRGSLAGLASIDPGSLQNAVRHSLQTRQGAGNSFGILTAAGAAATVATTSC